MNIALVDEIVGEIATMGCNHVRIELDKISSGYFPSKYDGISKSDKEGVFLELTALMSYYSSGAISDSLKK